MTLLGNILWLIFGGLIACVGYLLSGALLCLTIIGIPFGIQSIKIGIATLAPFGKNVIELPEAISTRHQTTPCAGSGRTDCGLSRLLEGPVAR